MKVAVLTISDRVFRGEREDQSGPALVKALENMGAQVPVVGILPDEREGIARRLKEIADSAGADVILTTGGTGVAPRDVTPEATRDVTEKPVPGLSEAMRAASLKTTPTAMLSRAEAGVRGRCLIVNLPGSPTGAVECFQIIAPALKHAVQLINGGHPDG